MKIISVYSVNVNLVLMSLSVILFRGFVSTPRPHEMALMLAHIFFLPLLLEPAILKEKH